MKTENNPGVPPQEDGSEMNATATREFSDVASAIAFYEVAARRLLDVNNWGKIAQLPLSSFMLCDERGARIDREAQLGDLIKIDIPGPGPKAGGGFDWVKIEYLADHALPRETVITVRPYPGPESDGTEVAHFLESDATSTFIVAQDGRIVVAAEHGRNEKANTSVSRLSDKVRNVMVGLAAKIGLSYPQWKSLVEGLLADEQ